MNRGPFVFDARLRVESVTDMEFGVEGRHFSANSSVLLPKEQCEKSQDPLS